MSWVRGQGVEFAEEIERNVMQDQREKNNGVTGKWIKLGGKKSRERLKEIEWL